MVGLLIFSVVPHIIRKLQWNMQMHKLLGRFHEIIGCFFQICFQVYIALYIVSKSMHIMKYILMSKETSTLEASLDVYV